MWSSMRGKYAGCTQVEICKELVPNQQRLEWLEIFIKPCERVHYFSALNDVAMALTETATSNVTKRGIL